MDMSKLTMSIKLTRDSIRFLNIYKLRFNFFQLKTNNFVKMNFILKSTNCILENNRTKKFMVLYKLFKRVTKIL